jgi:thioredoxin 1
MADEFLHVNEANFEKEVLQSAQPVVLEFGAAWCQPCKQLEPVLAKLGQEWSGRVRMVKVDVDESANLAMRFQVMGVPTVILFAGGKAVTRFSGYQPRERVIEKLSPHLRG